MNAAIFCASLMPFADSTPLDKRTLDHKDFIDTILYLLKLRRGLGAVL